MSAAETGDEEDAKVSSSEAAAPSKNDEIAQQLYDHIIKADKVAFNELLEEINKRDDIDLDYVLNKWVSSDEEKNTPLIVAAAKKNNMDMLKTLIEHKADVNRADKFNYTATYQACLNNNLFMLELLLTEGGNPSIRTTDTKAQTPMMKAAFKGNLAMMKMLLNEDKEYEHTFDWNNLINFCKIDFGYSAFHICCEKGWLSCVKYLLEMDRQFETKLKINDKAKLTSQTPFLTAVAKDRGETAKFLLDNVICKLDNFDINDADNKGNTALHYCALNGDIELMTNILTNYSKQTDINMTNLKGETPFFIACERNKFEFVEYLTQNGERLKLDVNLPNKENVTPLMRTVERGNVATVNRLCDVPSVNILAKDDSEPSAVDIAVQVGHASIFSKLVLTLFERYKIEDFESLTATKEDILNEKLVTKWLKQCKDDTHPGLFGFLTKLEDQGLNEKDFRVISALLESASTSNDQVTQNMEASFDQFKDDCKVGTYLYDNLSNACKNAIFKCVEKGMQNFESCFNDSILLLCYMVNRNKFTEILSDVTTNSLSTRLKTVEKYVYFKNKLLHSNIWAMRTGDESDYKGNNDNNNNQMLFNYVEQDVVSQELKRQKDFIIKQMTKIEKEFPKEFKQLQNNIKPYSIANFEGIAQNQMADYFFQKEHMGKQGVLTDYSIADMPFDNVNGFLGTVEYDYSGYLTKLLIASHNINPIFQKECRQYFTDLAVKHNIACRFEEAPVKTRERCVMKGKIDYHNNRWPHTSHILDTVRCTVVYDDLTNFLKGYGIFYNQFYGSKAAVYDHIGEHPTIIQCIVRVKNDFEGMGSLTEVLASNDEARINEVFTVKCVKCNVLIQYNDVRLIAEIQFLMKFMETAKKMGHSIYSFQRKHEFYEKLNDMIYDDGDIADEKLRKLILFRNLSQFSFFLQNVTQYEEQYILKNEKKVLQWLDQSKWKKGKELFAALFESKVKNKRMKSVIQWD